MYSLRSCFSAGKLLGCSGDDVSLASTREAVAKALIAMPFHAATICVVPFGLCFWSSTCGRTKAAPGRSMPVAVNALESRDRPASQAA